MAKQGTWPAVNRFTVNDLVEAIGAGVRDFRASPWLGLLIGGIFAAAGWLLIALLWYFDLPFFAYPLAMGFALVAPFAAVGFYAVSALLEAGERPTASRVWAGVRAAARRDLRWMALVTGFALVIWMDIAAFLFFGFVGFQGFGEDFLGKLFSTPAGLLFLFIGNASGALIALFVFSIAVVSFPMLYDRDVDFVTAMVTSVRLVAQNPVPMVIWCIIIAVLTGLSLLSGFFGLLIVLPIVGHATWHVYRRGVAAAANGTATAIS